MKKVLAGLLCGIFCLFMVACSKGEYKEPEPVKDADYPVEFGGDFPELPGEGRSDDDPSTESK